MTRKPIVIAIPVRDEAERIGKCLRALARQSIRANHIVLLLNNCGDDTAMAVRAAPVAAHNLHLIECSLIPPFASAGVHGGWRWNIPLPCSRMVYY